MSSRDGSGVRKNSTGGRGEKVILYALSSRLVQSLADFADRVRLAIAALGSEDVIRIRTSPKRSRHHTNNRDGSDRVVAEGEHNHIGVQSWRGLQFL